MSVPDSWVTVIRRRCRTACGKKSTWPLTSVFPGWHNFATRLPSSLETYRRLSGDKASRSLIEQKLALIRSWPQMQERLVTAKDDSGNNEQLETFLANIERTVADRGSEYIDVIQHLSPSAKFDGSRWLAGIVDETVKQAMTYLPGFD